MACADDTLRSKSIDGSILVMTSGAVYQPMLTVETFLWLPASAILVCQFPITMNGKPYMTYELINLNDSASGKVAATRLR